MITTEVTATIDGRPGWRKGVNGTVSLSWNRYFSQEGKGNFFTSTEKRGATCARPFSLLLLAECRASPSFIPRTFVEWFVKVHWKQAIGNWATASP